MLYILKFIYGTLLFPPGILIIAMLAAAYRLRRSSNKAAGSLFVFAFALYLCCSPLLSGTVMRSLESRYSPPPEVRGDVIIMLGGGATLDTPNIGGPGHLSGYAANRLLTAAQLYRKLGVPILVSGGKVFESTGLEADIAARTLLELGVPADKIIKETESLNTTQNAQFSAALLRAYGFRQPVLVTSAFHMHRAVLQFGKAGVTVVPFSTDYQTNRVNDFHAADLLPSSRAMQELVLGLKEYLGIAAAQWY